ncbi:MAG: hypothetical protein P8Y60_14180, partial [Calditrichota bacterium]
VHHRVRQLDAVAWQGAHHFDSAKLFRVLSSLWYLVIILVANSAIGLYYYLRIVVAMYSKPEEAPEKYTKIASAVPAASFVALLAVIILLVWYGVYPAEVVAWIKSMAASLNYMSSTFFTPVY